MNWLVFHVVSGHAFFSGIMFVLICVFATGKRSAVRTRAAVSFLVVGLVLVLSSSTAIPYWYYGITSVTTVVWGAFQFRQRRRHLSRVAAFVVWVGAALFELPHHIAPSLSPVSTRSLTVIGDSISAGGSTETRTETWPIVLARQNNLDVRDISRVGETTQSALRRVKTRGLSTPVVVVEIGGNDLLGKTSSREYGRALDALLSYVSAPGRQIVMFELPLLPFHHEFGRVQRQAAARHGVLLVPKRVLLSVLARSGSTTDSIHLTPAGHRSMAASVWRLIRSAYGDSDDM